MPEENAFNQQAFDYLAQQAGLAAGITWDDAHAAELFAYVRNALAPLQPVQKLDVTGVEPDMAFLPRQKE
jgi:hypothetical protein